MRLGLGHGLDVGYRPELFGNLALLQQYPGAAAAYSLRNIDGNTATNVVRVRRSSDNAEADFTAAEVTNGTLTTWTGANDGLVVTWYDQSGNTGRDATQATAANQPKIVNAGSLILENSLPCVQFDGTNDRLGTSYTPSATASTYFSVIKTPSSGTRRYWLSAGLSHVAGDWDGSGRYLLGYGASFTQYIEFTDATIQNSQKLFSVLIKDTGTSSCYVNAASKASGSITGTYVGSLNIGSRVFGDFHNNNIQEIIIYDSDKSADRADIEAAINSHYSIY